MESEDIGSHVTVPSLLPRRVSETYLWDVSEIDLPG
jgi:hypothetical protein